MTTTPPPDTEVPETLEQIAKRLPKELYNIVCFSCSEAFCKHWQEDASDVILFCLRNERERAAKLLEKRRDQYALVNSVEADITRIICTQLAEAIREGR